MSRFTFHRFWAIVLKEFIQMKRDRVTFAMMVGIPLMQLMLFGFAINMDVRNLDAAIVDQADTFASRAFVQEIAQSQVIRVRASLREALAEGDRELAFARDFARLPMRMATSSTRLRCNAGVTCRAPRAPISAR